MSIQLTLVGNRLVVQEGDLGPPGSVEAAAIHGASIIRDKHFREDNREIGYAVMCQMLEEGGHFWPRPEEDVIEKMLLALEAGRISEAEFVEWVCLRVATA